MTCRPSELAKIMKEAEIMMSMQHVSIVRALNCTVVQRKTAQVNSLTGVAGWHMAWLETLKLS